MPVRMLVTDLDNTLLRSDKSISDYTASVFQRCRERGMVIVFATPWRLWRRISALRWMMSRRSAMTTTMWGCCARAAWA